MRLFIFSICCFVLGSCKSSSEGTGNHSPTITVVTETLKEDEVTVIAIASDSDDDALTLEVVQEPTLGKVSLNANKEIVFEPQANAFGEDTLQIKVKDVHGAESEIKTMHLQLINDKDDAVLYTTVNSAVSSNVVAGLLKTKRTIKLTLATGECESLEIVQQPVFGSVSLLGCVATYTTTAAFENVLSEDTFTYKSTATQQSGTATVIFEYCGDGRKNSSETADNCPVDFAVPNTTSEINTMQAGTVVNDHFAPQANMTLLPGVYTFASITIPTGVTLSTNGIGVLILRAQGTIEVAGTINLNGGDGAFQNGGNTGNSLAEGSGGTFGTGSDGANLHGNFGLGGHFGGGNGGESQAVGGGGGGGGGYLGGNGGDGTVSSTCSPGGAGSNNASLPCDDVANANGKGGFIGVAAEQDLALSSTFYPGSGGGGGGGGVSSGMGGGGGGGGGALRLVTSGQLILSGNLTAKGGTGYSGTSHGGGGSGGVIDVRARSVNFSSTARISADLGLGGDSPTNDGGEGRVRLSTTTASCNATNTTFESHSLAGNVCQPHTNFNFAALEVYIGEWPN